MKISLIICTYMRPGSLRKLLKTVASQVKVPDEILIVDGSTDDETEKMIESETFETLHLKYYKVPDNQRGLTKQRNYGVARVSEDIDVIAFLDDDTELDKNYFLEIEKTYGRYPDAIGVSGYITNEVKWEKQNKKHKGIGWFCYDGWCRKEDLRNRLRRLLGLMPDNAPSTISGYANERAIGGIPPSGHIYKADYLQGAMMCFKKSVFDSLTFSNYFEGYGLYEDKDFSLRARQLGSHYINTNAKLAHYHDPLGRPNYIQYGKMTIRNGWRVWRIAVPTPGTKNIFKWYTVSILLMYARIGGLIKGPDRRKALEEIIGRHIGLVSLVFSKPPLD